jgi:hypothetical protein
VLLASTRELHPPVTQPPEPDPYAKRILELEAELVKQRAIVLHALATITGISILIDAARKIDLANIDAQWKRAVRACLGQSEVEADRLLARVKNELARLRRPRGPGD